MIELRLADWVGWRRRQPDHAVGTRSTAVEREPIEMQAAVEALPAPLRDTIVQCYLHSGDMAEHAARLGCPQSTVTRRISRAHLLLQEHFAQARAVATLAAERVAMADRLSGVARPRR